MTYIDLKRDFDNWNMPGCLRNSCQLNLSQEQVVSGHHAIAFKNTEDHRVLIVVSRGEVLDPASGNRYPARGDLVHIALTCFLVWVSAYSIETC